MGQLSRQRYILLVGHDEIRPSADVMTLGRGSAADVAIPGDRQISRVHVEVCFGRSGVTVRDLGSSNGSFLNGVRLQGRAHLSPSDVLRLGSTLVRVRTPAQLNTWEEPTVQLRQGHPGADH